MPAAAKRFIYRVLSAILLAGTLVTGAAAQSPPTISKAFNSATVGLNQSVTLTFTITNPNPATDLTGVSFSDDMPSGLLIANPDSLGGDCDTSVVTISLAISASPARRFWPAPVARFRLTSWLLPLATK